MYLYSDVFDVDLRGNLATLCNFGDMAIMLYILKFRQEKYMYTF